MDLYSNQMGKGAQANLDGLGLPGVRKTPVRVSSNANAGLISAPLQHTTYDIAILVNGTRYTPLSGHSPALLIQTAAGKLRIQNHEEYMVVGIDGLKVWLLRSAEHWSQELLVIGGTNVYY